MSQKQPQCPDCNDSGILQVGGKHDYCACDVGALLRTDAGDNATRWLERMDASIAKKPAEPIHAPSLPELEAEYYAHLPTTEEETPMTSNEELSDLRARFLALEGNLLIEIHGWLIGVACAVERQRGADPRDADRLMAELRASKGPPGLMPVMCLKCDWPASCCRCIQGGTAA